MARKVAQIKIDTEGRDLGKVFQITEMPAAQAEKWALRVFLAMAKSGIEVPEDIANAGLAGVAMMGLRSLGGMDWQYAEPLLDEMMTCAAIIPDPLKPNVVRFLVADDIEEIATRLRLRKEIFNLHTGFFTLAADST